MDKKEYTQTNAENAYIEVSILSELGDRTEQQDSSGIECNGNVVLITVCDGMGGHQGGSLASKIAVSTITNSFKDNTLVDYIGFLHNVVNEADALVSQIQDLEGNRINAGTTMVTVIIDKNQLFWSSVGDSRMYLLRKDVFIQATVDHNYRGYLSEKLMNGEIDKEIYEIENQRGEALLSYLGMNGLSLVDYNREPLQLMGGDSILITTDGLYKILNDSEIMGIIRNFKNNQECGKALMEKTNKMARKKKINRDNITFALIKVK